MSENEVEIQCPECGGLIQKEYDRGVFFKVMTGFSCTKCGKLYTEAEIREIFL